MLSTAKVCFSQCSKHRHYRIALEFGAMRARMVKRVHEANGVTGPLTVKAVVEAYLEFLEGNRKSAVDSRHRARAHIYPTLGNAEVASLTTDMLRRWHVGLVKALPRARTKPGTAQQHRAFDGSEEAVRRRRSSANRLFDNIEGRAQPRLQRWQGRV